MSSLSRLTSLLTTSLTLVACLSLSSVVVAGCSADTTTAEEASLGEGEDAFTVDLAKSERLLAKAVSMAEKRQTVSACESNEDLYLRSIIDTLRQAIAVRNTVWFRTRVIAKKTILQKTLGDTVEWQEILGVYDPSKPATLEKAFSAGVSLWDTNGGAYGNQQRIELKANGAAVIHVLDTESPDFHWNQTPTTWRLSGATLTLGTGRVLTLKWADGMLRTVRVSDGPGFVSLQSECEA